MQRKETIIPRKKEKITALFIAVAIIAISFIDITNWQTVGISLNASWQQRLLYPFFHNGIFHTFMNAWALLAIVFFFNVKFSRMITAYIVAALFPIGICTQLFALPNIPTVGLSAVIYFLLGSIFFELHKYSRLLASIPLILGFIFPSINGCLHLYGFLCGIFWALLNYPIKIEIKI